MTNRLDYKQSKKKNTLFVIYSIEKCIQSVMSLSKAISKVQSMSNLPHNNKPLCTNILTLIFAQIKTVKSIYLWDFTLRRSFASRSNSFFAKHLVILNLSKLSLSSIQSYFTYQYFHYYTCNICVNLLSKDQNHLEILLHHIAIHLNQIILNLKNATIE